MKTYIRQIIFLLSIALMIGIWGCKKDSSAGVKSQTQVQNDTVRHDTLPKFTYYGAKHYVSGQTDNIIGYDTVLVIKRFPQIFFDGTYNDTLYPTLGSYVGGDTVYVSQFQTAYSCPNSVWMSNNLDTITYNYNINCAGSPQTRYYYLGIRSH